MKVYFAADHAGFALKNVLVEYARTLGYETEDVGAFSFNPDDDYPDFVMPCAKRVATEPDSCGVVVGASGQGEAMVANRVIGVRAAVFYGSPSRRTSDGCREPALQTDATGESLDIISSMRAHNGANVLALGARFITVDEAKEAVKQFLETSFSDAPRHARRIAKF